MNKWLQYQKNVIFFEVDNSLSVHNDDREQDTSVFGVDLTQGLGDIWITAEAKYCTNFTESGKRFFLKFSL